MFLLSGDFDEKIVMTSIVDILIYFADSVTLACIYVDLDPAGVATYLEFQWHGCFKNGWLFVWRASPCLLCRWRVAGSLMKVIVVVYK